MLRLSAVVILACFTVVPTTQNRVRLAHKLTLCTLHPELCDSELAKAYPTRIRPVTIVLPNYEGRLRELQLGSNAGSDARKLIRALRSIDEKAEDKKSEKNYDFIRFGK